MLPDSKQDFEKSDNGDQKGDIQTLLANALEAVEQARTYNPVRLPQVLSTYVRLLTRDRQCDLALRYAQEILDLDPQSASAVEATVTMGICSAHANQWDTAEQYFQKAADLSRQISYLMGIARAYQYLTNLILLPRGQFHLALTLIEESGQLSEEQGNRYWNEPILRGFIYQSVGDRRHCRQILDELVLHVEPGTRLAGAYYWLWARLALDEDELEQAKEYLRLGLRVVNRVGAIDQRLWIHLEHSRYHRLKGEAPVARTWAEDALNLARRYNSQYFCGLAYIERAQANWDTAEPASAIADLDSAASMLEPLRAAYDLSRLYFLRALWYKQQNDPCAEEAWMKAVQQIIHNGYAHILEKEQDQAFPLIAAHARSKNPEVRQATETLMRYLANVLPLPLRITTLGQFAVWKGKRRLPDQGWNRRKAGELFRFLLLQPNRAAGREVIIESLWPDNDSGSPADLLNQATSTLRHVLEPDLPDKFPSRYLKVEGEHISLQFPTGSSVDFEHFERVLPLAMQTRNAERLQEALNLYSGELFPSDRYADWSAEKRRALTELRQRGLLALAKTYLDQGQFFNAITNIRSILHIDAWNEDAVLIGMQAYIGLQDVPHALQLFIDLERVLHNDLDIEPRLDLRNLAKSLRQRG
jgi:DNA-binding SARP family transcriptional activator